MVYNTLQSRVNHEPSVSAYFSITNFGRVHLIFQQILVLSTFWSDCSMDWSVSKCMHVIFRTTIIAFDTCFRLF